MTLIRFDLEIARACKTAQVPYEDFVSTVMAGSYPCLPGAVPARHAISTKPTCWRCTSMAVCAPSASGRCAPANMPAGPMAGSWRNRGRDQSRLHWRPMAASASSSNATCRSPPRRCHQRRSSSTLPPSGTCWRYPPKARPPSRPERPFTAAISGRAAYPAAAPRHRAALLASPLPQKSYPPPHVGHNPTF